MAKKLQEKIDIKLLVMDASYLKIIKDEFSSLDILINNAGSIVNKPFMKIDIMDWLETFGTNVFTHLRHQELY